MRLEARQSFTLGIHCYVNKGRQAEDYVKADLTGHTLTFIAVNQRDATQTVTKPVTLVDAAHGYARLYLQAADLDLDPGNYDYSLTVLTDEGYSGLLFRGEMELLDNQDLTATGTYSGDGDAQSVTLTLQQNNTITVKMGALTKDINYLAQSAYDSMQAAQAAEAAAEAAAAAVAAIPATTDALVASIISTSTSSTSAAIRNRYAAHIMARDPQYNVKGDGTTDDTAAINALITAVAGFTTGPCAIYFGAGTYMIAGSIIWKTNVDLIGAGIGKTIIKSTAGAAQSILIDGQGIGGMTLQDMTVDCNNRTNSIAVEINPGNNSTTVGTGYNLRRVRVANCQSNVLRGVGQSHNVLVEECIFDGSVSGVQIYEVVGQTKQNHRFVRCVWNDVGTNNLQFVGNSNGVFNDVLVEGCIQRNYRNVGANGPIPSEIWGVDNLRLIGNTFEGGGVGTRGMGFARTRYTTAIGNIITGMTIYASELSDNQKFTYSGNVIYNCAEWLESTAPITDGVITDNIFIGSGRSVLSPAGTNMVKLDSGLATRIKINDNLFMDWAYVAGAVKFGSVTVAVDCEANDNTFVISDPNVGCQAISLRRGVRLTANNNKFLFTRNLSASVAGSYDDNISAVIQLTLDASSSDYCVEGNTIWYTGSNGAVTGHQFIGHGSTAVFPGPPRSRIARNRVAQGGCKGLDLGSWNGADLVVEDNDTRSCAFADSFHSSLVYRKTSRHYNATAAPTAGTWQRGDIVWNTGSNNGQIFGWVCTAAGTPGTWSPINNSFGSYGATNKLIVANMEPGIVNGNAPAMTAGVAYVSRVTANQSKATTNLIFYCATAGVGLSNTFCAIYDSAGVLLATSADVSTSFQSTGQKNITIPSVNLVAGQDYYILIVVGAAATSMPVLRGTTVGGLNNIGTNVHNSYSSGLSAAPSPLVLGTLASVAGNGFMAAS